MFSVIIPLYNKESTIIRSINSVLSQSFRKFEIIIVNDGSTDKSLKIVKSFADKRIKVISQTNGGVSSARNLGIKKSNNEVIAFLDADDEWLPDYLHSVRNLIDKYPDCSMFGTGRFEVAGDVKTFILSKYRKEKDFIIDDYCKEPFIIQMSSLCIKNCIIKRIGDFPIGIKIGEDTDFKLRAACNTSIAYLNAPKTIYYLAMKNNSFSYKCTLSEIYPFWRWYSYRYRPRRSLYLYTTKKILERYRRILLPNSFKKRIPTN